MHVANGERVGPRADGGERNALLLERPGGERVVEDAHRAVLPALRPVAAVERPLGCQPLGDEVGGEHLVGDVGPERRAVRAVLARLGDGDDRLREHVARVVVRPGRVVEVAAGRVPVVPRLEASARVRLHRVVDARRVVEPVVGEARVGAEEAHPVARVVGDDRVAPRAVTERRVVVEHRLEERDRRRRVPGIPRQLPGEAARGARVGPVVALDPGLGELTGLLGEQDVLALLDDARRCRSGDRYLALHRPQRLRREPHAGVGAAGRRGGRRGDRACREECRDDADCEECACLIHPLSGWEGNSARTSP